MSNVENNNIAQKTLYRIGSYGKATPGETPQDVRWRGAKRVGTAVLALALTIGIGKYGYDNTQISQRYFDEFEQRVEDCKNQLTLDGAPEFLPLPPEDMPVVSGSPHLRVDHETYCEELAINNVLERE